MGKAQSSPGTGGSSKTCGKKRCYWWGDVKGDTWAESWESLPRVGLPWGCQLSGPVRDAVFLQGRKRQRVAGLMFTHVQNLKFEFISLEVMSSCAGDRLVCCNC